MTALMLENFKLVVLFVLIGSIIALSHVSGARPLGVRRRHASGRI